jgi:hypothetical protein
MRTAMPTPTFNLHDVPQAIQLALAPVFLLTGIAGVLNVMTGRLARIIDRGRHIAESAAPCDPSTRASVSLEIGGLERRRRLASHAITATTLSALLVCMVITALFLEVLLEVPLKPLIGALFTGSTLALVVGLATFLREVQLATSTVRIPPLPPLPAPPPAPPAG